MHCVRLWKRAERHTVFGDVGPAWYPFCLQCCNPSTCMIGETTSRYLVGDKLDEGGMGVVYKDDLLEQVANTQAYYGRFAKAGELSRRGCAFP